MARRLPPAQAKDVSQGATKQLGLTAQTEAVAEVERRLAALNSPGVVEALSQSRQAVIQRGGHRNQSFLVQNGRAIGTTQVDQCRVGIIQRPQNLIDGILARTGANATLGNAAKQGVQLRTKIEVLQCVVKTCTLLVRPIFFGQSLNVSWHVSVAVVESEPVGFPHVRSQHTLKGCLVVEPHSGAVVQRELLWEILGLNADVCPSPVTWQVGRLGFHDDKVVHQVGGEQVHFNAVPPWIHGWHLRSVECGLDVTIAESSDEHKVSYRAHSWNAFDGTRGVAVPSLFDLLAGDEIHAGGTLLFDVLHVHIARTIHFGHHLCGLLDDKGFDVQVEVDNRNPIPNLDRF